MEPDGVGDGPSMGVHVSLVRDDDPSEVVQASDPSEKRKPEAPPRRHRPGLTVQAGSPLREEKAQSQNQTSRVHSSGGLRSRLPVAGMDQSIGAEAGQNGTDDERHEAGPSKGPDLRENSFFLQHGKYTP